MDAAEKLEFEKLAGNFDINSAISQEQFTERYYDLLSNVKRGVDTYWMSEPLRIDRKTGGWFCDQYVCDRADNDGSRSHCKTIKDKENEKKYHYRPRRRGYRHGHNL